MRFVPSGHILTVGLPLEKVIRPLTLKHGPESIGCSLHDFLFDWSSLLLVAAKKG